MNIDLLFQNLNRNDKSAESEFFRHLTERFRLFAELKIRDKMDAEEVVQNAVMVVARKYRSIEFETSFAGWAHKVLSNEVLKYYRTKAYRDNLFMQVEIESSPCALWNPDPDFKRHLLDCVRKLCSANVRYARTLNLKYQGFEVEEICRRLKVTEDNLYVILSRARSLLRLCLEKGDIK